MATVKRIVTHPRFYMKMGGKLQHVPKGTELTLSEEQAARMRTKLADPTTLSKLDVKTGETVQGDTRVVELETELAKVKTDAEAALTAMAKQLDAAKKSAKK